MAKPLRSRAYYIGPVRIMGGVIAFLVTLSYFFRESGNDFLEILVDMYCPGFAIFLLWAMPFDVWVAKAFSTRYQDPAEQRLAFRSVRNFDALAWLSLAATWGVYFVQIVIERTTN